MKHSLYMYSKVNQRLAFFGQKHFIKNRNYPKDIILKRNTNHIKPKIH